jgi:uncharacterized protein YegP (UPF0339 family)
MADRIVVYRDEAGDWRWHRIAPNEERVSTSGEGFDSRRNAIKAAEREAEGTDAEVVTEDG